MKLTNNFNKFDNIVNNYINGNIADYKKQLNHLSKVDLIRFTSFLKFQGYNLHVNVNGYSELILIEN
jgi:hypothetical protein